MDHATLKQQLLKNPKFREYYYGAKDLSFEISEMIIDARIEKGLTQSALAKKVGTQQSSIARLESGSTLPSLTFLEKIAKVLGVRLISPKFGSSKGCIDPVVKIDLREYSADFDIDEGSLAWSLSGQNNIDTKTLNYHYETRMDNSLQRVDSR